MQLWARLSAFGSVILALLISLPAALSLQSDYIGKQGLHITSGSPWTYYGALHQSFTGIRFHSDVIFRMRASLLGE